MSRSALSYHSRGLWARGTGTSGIRDSAVQHPCLPILTQAYLCDMPDDLSSSSITPRALKVLALSLLFLSSQWQHITELSEHL